MVVEHNVSTMVRLSDTGEDTWQYWPSDEGERTLSFGYMTVTLITRETRVSYVKREFKVSNTKVRRKCDELTCKLTMLCIQAREEVNLTHFAYNEWPIGVSGSEDLGLVPGSTHGILGLVEHALAHQEEASLTGPIAVHCRLVIT